MHNPGPDIRGAEGLCGFITMYRAAMPDLRMTIEDMLADGDKVFWRVGAHAGHTNGALVRHSAHGPQRRDRRDHHQPLRQWPVSRGLGAE